MALVMFSFIFVGLIVAVLFGGVLVAWLATRGQSGRLAATAISLGVPLLGVYLLRSGLAPTANNADPITRTASGMVENAPGMMAAGLCLGVCALLLSVKRGRR